MVRAGTARVKALWTLLFLGLAIAPSVASEPEAIQTSIPQILQSPKAYANKIVRIDGQVDNCISLSCNICPTEMTNATFDTRKCLALEFEGFRDEGGAVGASELMDKAFRFAVVTLEARFLPACLGIDGAVCTDRATVLFDARVLALHARKTNQDGIVSSYDFGQLVAPSASEQSAMQSEIELLEPYSKLERKYFLVTDPQARPDKVLAIGLSCVCFEKTCEGKWPTRFFGGFDGVGNPYSCVLMEKHSVGWRVLPDPDF